MRTSEGRVRERGREREIEEHLVKKRTYMESVHEKEKEIDRERKKERERERYNMYFHFFLFLSQYIFSRLSILLQSFILRPELCNSGSEESFQTSTMPITAPTNDKEVGHGSVLHGILHTSLTSFSTEILPNLPEQ